jgi:uncharacterized protein (TIGR00255 family)
MTAFGRASSAFDKGTLVVEIQSTNRRFLEINLNIPRSFFVFEPLLRKLVSSQLGRGGIHIFVKYLHHPSQKAKVIPNLSLARGLKDAWETIASTLEVKEPFSLSLLVHEKELLSQQDELEDEESYINVLKEVCTKALSELLKMKETEGEALVQDLLLRVQMIKDKTTLIAQTSQLSVETYQKKLTERISTLLTTSLENDERLLKEIALFADKVDITEEIVRLNSHLQKTEELLKTTLKEVQETKGKILEFLVQEMLREANTMGSKAWDQKIVHLVIEIKAELEKIKEQSQNIE